MNIIINNSSMQPIYEQIVEQMKAKILKGVLAPDTMLPSVRTLSKDLRISALTVKKAYDALEQEGFVVTVHGKGSFVSRVNANLVAEQKRLDKVRIAPVDQIVVAVFAQKSRAQDLARTQLAWRAPYPQPIDALNFRHFGLFRRKKRRYIQIPKNHIYLYQK